MIDSIIESRPLKNRREVPNLDLLRVSKFKPISINMDNLESSIRDTKNSQRSSYDDYKQEVLRLKENRGGKHFMVRSSNKPFKTKFKKHISPR